MNRIDESCITLVVIILLMAPALLGSPNLLIDSTDESLLYPEGGASLASGPPMDPLLTEHGTITGVDDVFTYTTHIGETNTWDGSKWVRYIYDPGYDYLDENETHHFKSPSVRIGRLTFTHLPNGVIAVNHTGSGFTIEGLHWYAQYYFDNAWQNFTFDNYAFDGTIQTEDFITAYQRWWSSQGELNVSYTYSYYSSLKMRAQATNWAGVTVPVRIIWAALGIQTSGVNYSLIWDNGVKVGVSIGNNQQMFWHDVIESTPEIAINTIVDKSNRRAAVVFGNMSSTLAPGETMDIDPIYTVAADSDDDCWKYQPSTIHVDGSTTVAFHTYLTGASYSYYRGQARYALAIPAGVVINSAVWSFYEIQDDGNDLCFVKVIDEDNVGDLEADSSLPDLVSSPAKSHTTDTTTGWETVDVDTLVQHQVDRAGWASGQYIGLVIGSEVVSNHTFEDVQHAASNNHYLTITWEFPEIPPVNHEPTLDNPDDTDNMYAQYRQYQISQSVNSTPRGDNSWLTDFTYRKYHELTGATGAGTNYQIKLDVNYGAGSSYGSSVYLNSLCQADFDDIRFTDNDGITELDYWREEYTASGDATFWVEVADSLESGTVPIFIYYGNSTVSTTSNGANTFLFYEDWSSESTAAWTQWSDDAGGSVTYSATDAQQGGQVAKFTSGAGNLNDEYYSTAETTAAYSLMFRAKLELTTASYHAMRIGTGSPTEYAFSYVQSYSTTYYRLTVYDSEGTSDIQAMDSAHWGAYHTWEITRPKDGSDTILYIDGVFDETGNMAVDNVENPYATVGTTDSDKSLYSDWFAARKFVVTEPTHGAWGQQDKEGFNDIDYIEMSLYSNDRVTEYWKVRYDEDTDTFSEQTDASNMITLDTGSSSATESGLWVNVTYYITIHWNHTDLTDTDVKCYSIGTLAEDYTDWYEVDWDVETRVTATLILSDGSGTVDRGDYNTEDSITASGTIIYYGSGDDNPPDEIDVYVADDEVAGSPWGDTSLTSGAFSMTVDSDDAVGLDTYWVYCVDDGAGSSGTKVNASSVSDTYVADRAKVNTYAADDSRIDINTASVCHVTVIFEYDVNSIATGTLTVNGVSATYNALMGRWDFGETKAAVQSVTYDTVATSGNIHGITAVNQNGKTLVQTWDRVEVTLSANYRWTVIDYNVTLSYTGIFESDSSSWSGVATLNSTGGTLYPVESTVGTYAYGVTAITDPTHGITVFTDIPTTVIWDDASLSSSTGVWTQESIWAVYYFWQSGTWTWEINGTTLDTGADGDCIIRSHLNGTHNDYAIVSTTGDIGGLIIGPCDATWYYATIAINVETTVNGASYDFEHTSFTVEVDILHTIKLEDTIFYLTDNWVTVGFHTNWNNASYHIWDNDSYVGESLEGYYQFAKSTTVGLHNITVLVNGSHGVLSSTSQTKTSWPSSSSWVFRNFKYTVNPVTFSITGVMVLQNNETIIVAGTWHTPNTTLTWIAYEAGVQIDSGTLTLAATGEYNSIYWEKNEPTTFNNFTLSITADGSTINLHSYSLVLDTATYLSTYSGSSFIVYEGDTYLEGDTYQGVPEEDIVSMILAVTAFGFVMLFIGGVMIWWDEKKKKERDFRAAISGS